MAPPPSPLQFSLQRGLPRDRAAPDWEEVLPGNRLEALVRGTQAGVGGAVADTNHPQHVAIGVQSRQGTWRQSLLFL